MDSGGALPEEKPSRDGGRLVYTLAGTLAVIPLALYARSFGYGLLGLDDTTYYLTNSALKEGAWDGLAGVFRWYYSEFFPATQVTIWLDLRIFGSEQWWGPRLQQLAWFAGCVLAVRALVFRVTGRKEIAFAVAAIFAVHPVAATSTLWLANRKTLVALCFSLWAIERYVASRQRETPRGRAAAYGVSLVCFALALLSKPHALATPVMLMAYEWVLGQDSRKRRLLTLAPFACMAAAFLAFLAASGMRSDLAQTPLGGSTAAAIGSSGVVLWRYLWHAVAPMQLSFYYEVAEWPAASPLGWFAWLGISVFCIAVSAIARDRPRVAFGWAFGLAGVLPALNFVPQPIPMADHYMLWALPGWLLALVLLADGWIPKVAANRVVKPALAVLLLLFAVASYLRIPAFESNVSLFKQNTEREPGSSLARANYALALASKKDARHAPAIEAASIAALRSSDWSRLLPHQFAFVLKKGVPGLVREGQLPEANAFMKRATDSFAQADSPALKIAVAEIRVRTGDPAGSLRMALELAPPELTQAMQAVRAHCRSGETTPDALQPLLILEAAQGSKVDDSDRAAAALFGCDTLRVMAAAYLQLGDPERAFDAAALLVNLRPGDAGARMLLKSIYQKLDLAAAAEKLNAQPASPP